MKKCIIGLLLLVACTESKTDCNKLSSPEQIKCLVKELADKEKVKFCEKYENGLKKFCLDLIRK